MKLAVYALLAQEKPLVESKFICTQKYLAGGAFLTNAQLQSKVGFAIPAEATSAIACVIRGSVCV